MSNVLSLDTLKQTGFKCNIFLKWHYISKQPSFWQNAFYASRFMEMEKSLYLDVDSINIFADLVYKFGGYMGCYMSPEYKITQINFRLLGSILQECGGLFTVTSGCVFSLMFFFIYREWNFAALKSVTKYSNNI